MVHKMRLVDFAFKAIKNGTKDIEIRLNDEKRQLIKIGDKIEFKNLDTDEVIIVDVINLYHFDSFADLFDNFKRDRLGLKEDDKADIMNSFYTKDEEKKYGVLGIQIKINM